MPALAGTLFSLEVSYGSSTSRKPGLRFLARGDFLAFQRAAIAAQKEAIAADVAYTGQVLLATARAELPASEEEDTDAAGVVRRKKSLQRAASTAQAGAALLMPSIHGRGAGRQAPVQIHANNAAFFGGVVPVGSLDDFRPEGLPE